MTEPRVESLHIAKSEYPIISPSVESPDIDKMEESRDCPDPRVHKLLQDLLIIWLTECVTDWLSVWMTIWLSNCLTEWVFYWLSKWLSECLA